MSAGVQSIYTHTHTTHTHTYRQLHCAAKGLVCRQNIDYRPLLRQLLFFCSALCFALLCSPFPVSHCSPCCRLPFVVVCMLDKNQTDPVLTYVTAASWCRSPRALFPLSPAHCSVCSAFIKNSFVFLSLISKPKYCAVETKL